MLLMIMTKQTPQADASPKLNEQTQESDEAILKASSK